MEDDIFLADMLVAQEKMSICVTSFRHIMLMKLHIVNSRVKFVLHTEECFVVLMEWSLLI